MFGVHCFPPILDNTMLPFSNFVEALFDLDNSQHLQREDIEKCLRVVFPSKKYIEESSLHESFAACLHLSKRNYEKPSFLKGVIHDFVPNKSYKFHEGLFPHNKVILVVNNDYSVDDDTLIYIGSHNISTSAWGRLVMGGSQYHGVNTEMGVVFPPGNNTRLKKLKILESLSFSMDKGDFRVNVDPFFQEI